ncbi:MAG TPA: HlyD family efflux transporter periplasmic adaptor subunit [Thermoanaerobaculia bacterium]|jgi:RND family efflux transporter MFP subunit
MSAVFDRSLLRELAAAGLGAARRRARLLALGAGAVVLLLLLVSSYRSAAGREAGTFRVRRGMLEPTVPLVGALVPARSETYGAAVPGIELKILWLVEEGTLVAPGDRLIEFDPGPFQKEFETARARAQELTGETEGARLAVDALRLKSTADFREKDGNAALSEQELSALVNTTAPLSAQESANEIAMRERALDEAQTKLTGLEPFVGEGYVSQEEFRAAQARRDQAEADLRLARAKHSALVHQTTPDSIRRKSQEAETSRLDASGSRERARIELAQAQAAASVSAARLDEANRLVAEAQRKIAACTVTAKAPGLAVHSETFDKSGERRKIRVGDSVWGGTTVVTLPDLSAMLVEGRVPESEIHLLSPDEPVRVALDAFPALALEGRLRSIGSVGSSERNDARSFPVTIALTQADSRFRPGMVSRCTVVAKPLRDVLFVPVDAVRSDEAGQYVLVASWLGRTSSRRVQTGVTTSQFVEVTQGLREGDTVRLVAP